MRREEGDFFILWRFTSKLSIFSSCGKDGERGRAGKERHASAEKVRPKRKEEGTCWDGGKEESGKWVRLEEDEGDDSKIGNISRGFLFRRRVSTLDPMGFSLFLSLPTSEQG